MKSPWKPFDDARARRRRLALAVAALLAVVLWGTLGLMWIEGWDFTQALYFTLITVTTVGYGDEGIGPSGRIFAMLFLVVGIGVCSYSFANLVQGMVADKLAWRRRMQAKIEALGSHVIVCGFGRMGSIVCRELLAAGRPFVVVEQHEQAWHAAIDAGYLALQGSASDDEVLEAAGIARATHLVSVVDSIEENIAISLSARYLNPALHIQARAERPAEERKLRRAGADRVVSPFHAGGLEVATALLRPKVAE
ncbi:MAG TPA: potassium channel family protein, partial [Planctomycetota bacterium]|nr:potassium channel family protein [Planctomycetota bacterium]